MARSALERAAIETLYEVERVCAEEGIDADLRRGGTLHVAQSPAQLARLREEVAHEREWGGLGEDDLRLLEPGELASRMRVDGALGASYTPHCARIHPAKLVRGLADGRRAPRCDDLRGHAGAARRQPPGRDRAGTRPCRVGRVRHRGLHGSPARPAPGDAAARKLDDRDRAAARERLERDRLGCLRDAARRRARLQLLAAHGRRAHRDRRARRALPLRLGRRPQRRVPARDRGAAAARAHLAVPRDRRGGDRASLGGRARPEARLVRVRHGGSDHGQRVGGRLRRQRREHRQPGRPHARRPDARARERAGLAALGGASVSLVRARAPAIPWRPLALPRLPRSRSRRVRGRPVRPDWPGWRRRSRVADGYTPTGATRAAAVARGRYSRSHTSSIRRASSRLPRPRSGARLCTATRSRTTSRESSSP